MPERPIIMRGTPNPSETPETEINEEQTNATSGDGSHGADSDDTAATAPPTQADDDETPTSRRTSAG